MTVTTRTPVFVALDSNDPAQILELGRQVGPSVGGLKIGLTAFAANGPGLVRELAASTDIFLDLKLHDIPAQVEGAIGSLNGLGVSLTTVHATGGRAMIEAAVGAAAAELKVIAVTILTSLEESDLVQMGMTGDATKAVLKLAEVALSAGAHGLVCSPLEVEAVRTRFGPHAEGGPYLVVPGIRPAGSAQGDQRRTLGPREALDAGADLLIIGRPITAAPDPAEAARRIVATL